MSRLRDKNGWQPFVLPLVILAIWEVMALRAASPLMPGPVQVLAAIVKLTPAILADLRWTLMRAAAGFAVAAVIMIPLGILLGRFRFVGTLLEPLMDMVATLPPPAVVPVVMLFSGTGDAAKISIIAYATSVPLLMNSYEASKTLHPMSNLVARSLRLSRFETMLHVDLPSSLPMIATGVRLAVASALLVSVTSEMLLATNGIGVFLQRQQENFQIAAGLAGIAFISLAGMLVNAGVARLERRWLFWHYRSTGSRT